MYVHVHSLREHLSGGVRKVTATGAIGTGHAPVVRSTRNIFSFRRFLGEVGHNDDASEASLVQTYVAP